MSEFTLFSHFSSLLEYLREKPGIVLQRKCQESRISPQSMSIWHASSINSSPQKIFFSISEDSSEEYIPFGLPTLLINFLSKFGSIKQGLFISVTSESLSPMLQAHTILTSPMEKMPNKSSLIASFCLYGVNKILPFDVPLEKTEIFVSPLEKEYNFPTLEELDTWSFFLLVPRYGRDSKYYTLDRIESYEDTYSDGFGSPCDVLLAFKPPGSVKTANIAPGVFGFKPGPFPESKAELFIISASVEQYLQLSFEYFGVIGWQLEFSKNGSPSYTKPWLRVLSS